MDQPRLRRTALAIVLLGFSVTASGEYYLGQLNQVPINRLIENLERKLAREPENPQAHYLLARVHSMAYATGQKEFNVSPDSGEPRFEDGASGVFIPPSPTELPDDNEEKQRRLNHLETAIKLFERALELDRHDLHSRVGLGWALMKAGKDQEALHILRPAFETAWENENDARGGEWGRSLTVELGNYLLALLDPQDDADEINLVQRRIKVIESKPHWITPILIPLGENIQFSSLVTENPSVDFDLDGTGLNRRWQWLTPHAGWLVYDPFNSGRIHSGRDMVGARTFWVFWSNGYEALAALDDNDDGALRNSELNGLSIWRDADSDGISDRGEVLPLADWGIVELQCVGYQKSPDLMGNAEGVRFANGTSRPSYDWSPMGIPIEPDPPEE